VWFIANITPTPPLALEYTTAVFDAKHLPVVVSYTRLAKSLFDIFVDRKTSNDGLTLISTRLIQFNGWKHGRALNPENRNNVPNDNTWKMAIHTEVVLSVCTRRGVSRLHYASTILLLSEYRFGSSRI